MKRLLLILTLSILYILLTSDSCSREDGFEENRQNKSAESARDSIVSEFSSGQFSPQDLMVFEETAIQHLGDLTDYAGIASDTTLDSTFRLQASASMRHLFISRHDQILLKLADRQPGSKAKSVAIPQGPAEFIWEMKIARPDSVWIASRLTKVNDTMFEGRLGFSRENAIPSGYSYLAAGSMEFFLVRSSKPFGSDTFRIWTVALGNSY